MINILGNLNEILNTQVSGFHQYILNEPIHLSFVSENLCKMVGYSESELLNNDSDSYGELVYSADRNVYSDFIKKLSEKPQSLSVDYRLVHKNGTLIYVNDSATSELLSDGTMSASSVLTDITSVKEENEELRFLNETVPCGFLKYTCEKEPKITYINDRMKKILRFSEDDGDSDVFDLYRDDLYLMIPLEERRRFSHFLEEVYTRGRTVAGEISVLRRDGTKARVYGWVTKTVNEFGQEEFQSVCMDITERYKMKKSEDTQRYIKALTEVYDLIFEYDFSANTVKCVYGENSGTFKPIENIPMQLEEATEHWIRNSVVDEDRERFGTFFRSSFKAVSLESNSKPPQIEYRALSSDGTVKKYMGIVISVDKNISLFCCRNVKEEDSSDLLRSENESLRNMNENMQELVMRFTDGIVAFEIIDGRVKPLYASDNVCDFFGYTKEEWISMSSTTHSIKKFVEKSGVEYDEFAELFSKGDAEFDYTDVKTGTTRRIKAVCSNILSENDSHQYVMLYNVNSDSSEPSKENVGSSGIYIRTFGYFDVFVNDKPIAFRNKKSKELFALLVDRRGGFVTSEEAISFLWEDEPISAVTLSRYRKVALRLKNILEEYGISHVVESVDGKRRIDTSKVRCDLYDYLSQKEEFSQLFKGTYLSNYSWGESTLGELIGNN